MTTYLFESGLSMLVLLGLYKLVLENQPMHHLKRAYLLGTLLVSLVAPLIRLEVPVGTLPVVATNFAKQAIDSQLTNINEQRVFRPEQLTANVTEPVNYWRWLYGVGTALMLLRFGRNLYILIRQIRMNPTQPFRGAVLVRLPGGAIGVSLPYTFLHYLFVPDAAYERGEIAGELFTHELAHIRQRHSLDVLLVELVVCFGWFNPGLFWLKRAMQLNHEFLADEAVNRTHRNVMGYQELLFSKLTYSLPVSFLISTFTFQTTKQRLTMMTKQASPVRTWLVAGATVLLFGSVTLLLIARTVAQQVSAVPVQKATTKTQPAQTDVAEMERLYGEKLVSIPTRIGAPLKEQYKKFKDLTPAEKARVVVLKPEARKTPTEAEWNDFKNTKKYGIWVNGKRRRDNPMSKYSRTDIVHFWYSFVHKNARQPEGYLYQLELDTEEGYQQILRDWEAKPWMALVTKEAKDTFEKRQKARSGK